MRRGHSCHLRVRLVRLFLQRIAPLWLLLRSIHFSRCVQVIPTIPITRILVTTHTTAGLDLGGVGSGRAIRSGDAMAMDLGMGSGEALGISADLGRTGALPAVMVRAGRMSQLRGQGT